MSNEKFKVVIHFAAEYGQVEYDMIEKSIRVVLNDAKKKEAVEQYLSEPHMIPIADGQDIHTFHPKLLNPLENLESFKQVMTRLWHHTGVYVDWSRPAV